MLYDVRAKTWKKLMQAKEHFGYLTWSHDGKSLFYDTNTTNQPGFFKMRISDGKVERVVDLKPYRLYPGPFGGAAWTGLAVGDAPMFMRDISTSEIYAFDVDFP